MKSKSKYSLVFSLLILVFFVTFSCKKKPDPAPLPFADFFVGNNGCIAPCTLYFYDNSTNAVSWEWNFGNNFNSTTQDDSMKYNSQGFYDVRLRVENTDGVADSVTKQIYVY